MILPAVLGVHNTHSWTVHGTKLDFFSGRYLGVPKGLQPACRGRRPYVTACHRCRLVRRRPQALLVPRSFWNFVPVVPVRNTSSSGLSTQR